MEQSLSIIIRPDEPFIVISFSNVYFGLSLLRKIRIATEVHFVGMSEELMDYRLFFQLCAEIYLCGLVVYFQLWQSKHWAVVLAVMTIYEQKRRFTFGINKFSWTFSLKLP